MSDATHGRAALGEIHKHMLELHRQLIDITKAEYERDYGKVSNPYALYNLVLNDPAFAWLRPMSGLLVQVGDALDVKEPSDDELAANRQLVDAMLNGPADDNDIASRLQTIDVAFPAIGELHRKINAALQRLP